jgi:penicillin-binding protein 2
MGPSKTAAAVVMDVKTGEILSMVSLPTYDNNVFTNGDDAALQQLLNDPAKPLINNVIAGAHPPGSTFKQITGTAALQEGVANTDTTITSYGSICIQNDYNPNECMVFKDWRALGTMNFYQGLAWSSDVYFYYLSGGYYEGGQTIFSGLGAERLARYAREYGLGALTGIDLAGEEPGVVPNAAWKEENIGESWYLGDTYNFGIGQGYLQVTPLQLVRVTTAIANGGDLLTPRLLHAVTDKEGNVLQEVERHVAHRMSISSENLGIMREAMRQAADYGPANTGASQYVTIAAKTGTAEFGPRHADGSYDSHAWYAGYAPYDDPQIAVVVFLERGIGATNGGPVARQIFDYYFGRQNTARGQMP